MNILAYIDPAATALIWQILAGVVITVGVVFGIWWRKITTGIKSICAKLFGKKQDASKTDEPTDEFEDEIQENSDEAPETEFPNKNNTDE